MSFRACASLALIMCLLAAPAAALADGGAGDQQYQDPLALPKTQKPAKKQAAAAPVASAPAPASSAAPATSANTTTATPPTPAVNASGQLPRTGFPTPVVLVCGMTLIAAGAALRRRTVPR